MESSEPIELVNQSIRWEGPRGMDLEVQRKSKNQSIIHALLPLWFSCLPQWKVASGSDYLSVTLPTSRVPTANLTKRLALCPCTNVLLENAWATLLSALSTSHWNLPDCISFLGIQSVALQNEKQPVNWVITTASLAKVEKKEGGGNESL